MEAQNFKFFPLPQNRKFRFYYYYYLIRDFFTSAHACSSSTLLNHPNLPSEIRAVKSLKSGEIFIPFLWLKVTNEIADRKIHLSN